MMCFWQVAVIFGLSSLFLQGEEPARKFAWDPPKVVASVFTQDLEMLDSERDEYSTNLATYASNAVVAAKASGHSLAEARKVLGLALQLSPRNKRAVVVSFQFGKGLLPEMIETHYSPPVLARSAYAWAAAGKTRR